MEGADCFVQTSGTLRAFGSPTPSRVTEVVAKVLPAQLVEAASIEERPRAPGVTRIVAAFANRQQGGQRVRKSQPLVMNVGIRLRPPMFPAPTLSLGCITVLQVSRFLRRHLRRVAKDNALGRL